MTVTVSDDTSRLQLTGDRGVGEGGGLGTYLNLYACGVIPTGLTV